MMHTAEQRAEWTKWGPLALVQYRNRETLTQGELGTILGVSGRSIMRWESGAIVPRTADIRRIRTLVNMPMPVQPLPQII